MPNFRPLRRYVFSVVDRWIAAYRLEPPFLEIGCGTGLLAAHLAARGWDGVALDSSPDAVTAARATLATASGVRIVEGGLAAVGSGPFRTVLLMDVLEHVQDDAGLLREIAARLAPAGWLVLLTPVNPREWGHDDVLYGHFRRYGWEELDAKLEAAGLTRVDRWNVTVPFMWALRRLYLMLLPRQTAVPGRDTLTAASAMYNPWDARWFLRAAGAVFGLPLWWVPLFAVQDAWRGSRGGHAAMVLARKLAA